MKQSRLFGKYIRFPGESSIMGTITLDTEGHFSPLEWRGLEGYGAFLYKRYHSPTESFAFATPWLVLGLQLVPERPRWMIVAALLCLVAGLFGRLHMDLWGEHQYTGGNHDFYVHGRIPYKLGRYEEL